MALYIDTEFNGFGGPLISMAIVSSATGKEFYEVRDIVKKRGRSIVPWVMQNVVPKLDKDPITDMEFKEKLWAFMREHAGEAIFADWPEDIAHLMQWMCKENGITPKLNYVIYTLNTFGVDIEPEVPHNALSDARALMDWHLEMMDASANSYNI
jgi:hypothetical protein